MKHFTFLAAAMLVMALGLSTAQAQNTRYYDINDDAPGSGLLDDTANPWDTTTPNWNPNSDGSGAGPGTTVPWVNGDDAVFSAGSDAAGIRYGLNIVAGTSARNITIKDGTVLINVGKWNMTGVTEVLTDATLETKASLQFEATGTLKLSGGRLLGSNAGNAGTIVNNLIPWEINGSGIVQYDDGDGINDNKVSIINGSVITGTGGTPSNGGAGTLIKRGPDQVGYAVRDTGGGIYNFTLNSFAKLRVEQGAFRLRNVGGVVDERLFGAVPLNELPDAIVLDGGGIGSNLTVTLDAKRGITIGSNGGYFDNGAGAGMIIPGPISGSGKLTIGSPTSAAVSNVTFTLSNPGNINTFSGMLEGVRGVLQLNSSLNVAGIADNTSNPAGVNNATINIASGQTLTVGSGNGNDTWSRPIASAGSFTKVGTGTQILSGANTYTGDTTVEKGTLSITTAYLADAADVLLKTGGMLNLGFAGTDTINQLFIDGVAQAVGTWGGTGSGASNISALLSGTGTLTVTTGAVVGLPGDFNLDSKVDAADYVTWRKSGTNPLPNDNGAADAAGRYAVWRQNFGNPPGAGSSLESGAAVPEPATIGLVLIGLAALGCGRRNRAA